MGDAAEKLIVGEYRPRRAKRRVGVPAWWPYPVAVLMIFVFAYLASFFWPMPWWEQQVHTPVGAAALTFPMVLPLGIGVWWVADWLAKRD